MRLNAARVFQELASVVRVEPSSVDAGVSTAVTAHHASVSLNNPAATTSSRAPVRPNEYTELCFSLSFTDLLNMTLLTSAELFDLRAQLRTRAPPVLYSFLSYTRACTPYSYVLVQVFCTSILNEYRIGKSFSNDFLQVGATVQSLPSLSLF